jgi:hypothetical protein
MTILHVVNYFGILTDPISFREFRGAPNRSVRSNVYVKHRSDKQVWFQLTNVLSFSKSSIEQIARDLKKEGLELKGWDWNGNLLNLYVSEV